MPVTAQNCAAEILGVIPHIMRSLHVEMRQGRVREFSFPQFRALHFLDEHENASLSELARELGLMLPAASKIANSLVADRLVRRRAHAVDRRFIALALTRSGKAELAARHRFMSSCLARHLAALPARDRVSVAAAMRLLRPLFTKEKTRAK